MVLGDRGAKVIWPRSDEAFNRVDWTNLSSIKRFILGTGEFRQYERLDNHSGSNSLFKNEAQLLLDEKLNASALRRLCSTNSSVNKAGNIRTIIDSLNLPIKPEDHNVDEPWSNNSTDYIDNLKLPAANDSNDGSEIISVVQRVRSFALQKSMQYAFDLSTRGYLSQIVLFCDYIIEHGDALVKQKYKNSDGIKLGKVCNKWRQKKGDLPKFVIDLMDKVGMVWGEVWMARFLRSLALFRPLHEQHGDDASEYYTKEMKSMVSHWYCLSTSTDPALILKWSKYRPYIQDVGIELRRDNNTTRTYDNKKMIALMKEWIRIEGSGQIRHPSKQHYNKKFIELYHWWNSICVKYERYLDQLQFDCNQKVFPSSDGDDEEEHPVYNDEFFRVVKQLQDLDVYLIKINRSQRHKSASGRYHVMVARESKKVKVIGNVEDLRREVRIEDRGNRTRSADHCVIIRIKLDNGDFIRVGIVFEGDEDGHDGTGYTEEGEQKKQFTIGEYLKGIGCDYGALVRTNFGSILEFDKQPGLMKVTKTVEVIKKIRERAISRGKGGFVFELDMIDYPRKHPYTLANADHILASPSATRATSENQLGYDAEDEDNDIKALPYWDRMFLYFSGSTTGTGRGNEDD